MTVVTPLPEMLRIGFKDFRVEQWDTSDAAGANRMGECCHLASRIRVDTVHGDTQTANTFIHEVLHACWKHAELDDEDKEERVVSALANQLTQVFRDNPQFTDYLKTALGKS